MVGMELNERENQKTTREERVLKEKREKGRRYRLGEGEGRGGREEDAVGDGNG